MKTLGIVGGTGPEATVDYYRMLIAGYCEQRDDRPSIIINSIDVKKMLGLIGAGKLPEVTDYLVAEVERLARAGADFGLLAANTPHIVFEGIQSRSSLPLISIVEAAREAARGLGVGRLGLLGPCYVMQGDFYPRVFSEAGIALIPPRLEEQAFVHDKYINELMKNIFLDETRERLLSIVQRLVQEEGVQAVVLAGTELPLILRDAPNDHVPFLDTNKIHVQAALRRLLA